jgi:5-methylcytosine-specific restriction endonuclease McrA
MNRKPNCTCKICGKPIYRRPAEIERSKGNLYCSQECFGKACRRVRTCPVCGRELVNERFKKACSRACANKARTGIKYKQGGQPYKDKVKDVRALKKRLVEARGAACEKCGYANVDILVIHHVIRRSDGGSNELDNLELICPNRHAEIHFYGVKHSQKGRGRIEATGV